MCVCVGVGECVYECIITITLIIVYSLSKRSESHYVKLNRKKHTHHKYKQKIDNTVYKQ